MSRIGKIARRTFLLGSVAIAGGVAFGYWKYKQPYGNPLDADLAAGEAALTPYIKIGPNGVTIYSPRAEMGQGVMTTLAALVAEELDVELDQITVEQAPVGFAYYNSAVLEEALPFLPYDNGALAETMRSVIDVPAKLIVAVQLTGGSSSTPDAYEKLRIAGAAARIVLTQAASQKLNIAEAQLRTEAGAVIAPDGTRIPYEELAGIAAGIEPPADPPLRPRSEWRIIGTSTDRVDMVPKCTGTAAFSLDTRHDGLLYAAVRLNPRIGGTVKSYDSGTAETMRGVRQIVPISGGVAVVATNTWYAMEAAKAITFEWGDAPYPADTAAHMAEVAASFTEDRRDSRNRDDGDVDAMMPAAAATLEYRAPYLAHATMEPLNATVLVGPDRLDIWTGTQNPTLARQKGADATGLPLDQIRVHNQYLGGGFGRRGEADYVALAIEVAQALPGIPVKTTFSREQDMCQDFYRPMAVGRVRGDMVDGKLKSLDISLASAAAAADGAKRAGIALAGPDGTIVQAAWEQPYKPENFRVTGYRVPTMLPVGFWRSVGASQNAFFVESALDELAHGAGLDPVAMRLDMIDHKPSRAVIETVAEMANWGTAPGAGRARGFAFSLSFGVPTAEIVEITETDAGLKVDKVWAAVDVGIALDPRNIEGQVISGVNFGLSAAILNEVTLVDGEVQQTNFHNYEALRMYQAPSIEVKVLELGQKIRGVGEPGTPPAAPALGNAIFALTGQRLREMPFGKSVAFA